MLRPRKKYTVYDLQQLKGKRCLTHIHVKSPAEAAAAEQAGVDLMSCSFDSPEAQARLPLLVAAAPNSFLSGATPHGLASPEEAIRVAFRALELGASSVYCSASPFIVEDRRLQQERVAAFSEYIADVNEGRFPERCHLVEMDAALLDEVVRSVTARNTAAGKINSTSTSTL